MIGKEREFHGDHFNLDFYQYLEQPDVPVELCPKIRALHAGKKLKAIGEVGFPAHKNLKQFPQVPSGTLVRISVSQVSLENFLALFGGAVRCWYQAPFPDFLLFFSPDAEFQNITSKWPAVWVKISSSWVCLFLYAWTLVAPVVLTNRDFS